MDYRVQNRIKNDMNSVYRVSNLLKKRYQDDAEQENNEESDAMESDTDNDSVDLSFNLEQAELNQAEFKAGHGNYVDQAEISQKAIKQNSEKLDEYFDYLATVVNGATDIRHSVVDQLKKYNREGKNLNNLYSSHSIAYNTNLGKMLFIDNFKQ
jgi:hypothetical protein